MARTGAQRFIDYSELAKMKKVRLLIVLLCLVSLLPTANYFINQKSEQIKKQQRELLENKLTYWENIVVESPTYRDAYVQKAIINMQLGVKPKAQEFLRLALELDPGWVVPLQLQELLP